MRPAVPTKDATAVAGAVQAAYLGAFPDGDRTFVRVRPGRWIASPAGWRNTCRWTPVPSFEHTLQGTLCLARLLHALASARTVLTRRHLELALLAILLHDTGYLKKRDDRAGTGAKYTATHVRRGVDFAAEFLTKQRFEAAEIGAVQNMILCTGLNAALAQIPFRNAVEKIAGLALGTADLLGQMAAADYVDKLPALYAEFAEAARHSPEAKHPASAFTSAEELRRKTPAFWKDYVRPKLDKDFAGVHQFLNDPYPAGPNCYLDAIEANIARLRHELEASEVSATAVRG